MNLLYKFASVIFYNTLHTLIYLNIVLIQTSSFANKECIKRLKHSFK